MAAEAAGREPMKDIFTGKLVRLSAFDPEEMSKAIPRWNQNSEYFRLLNASARPMYSSTSVVKRLEEEVSAMSLENYFFSIRTLAEGKLSGGAEMGTETSCGRAR